MFFLCELVLFMFWLQFFIFKIKLVLWVLFRPQLYELIHISSPRSGQCNPSHPWCNSQIYLSFRFNWEDIQGFLTVLVPHLLPKNGPQAQRLGYQGYQGLLIYVNIHLALQIYLALMQIMELPVYDYKRLLCF